MKEIPMGGGLLALVDDCDWDQVKMHRWFLYKGKTTHYAGTKRNKGNIYLHRFVLGLDGKDLIDHKDGNGLNCCRDNLRVCDNSQNACNSVPRNGKKFKGTTFDKRRSIYNASITKNYKNYYLGSFKEEIDAARAYDNAAREMHGEFARLNFPGQMWAVI